jgi:hypothetical protein
MTHDPDRARRLLLDDEDRPLDVVQFSSNKLNQHLSAASSAAADNLLTKARRRLQEGQEQQAEAFIQRALRLAYDEHEEQQPALWSAHMALFMTISDDLEASDPADQSWLDRAVALIGAFGPAADAEIRSCLRTFLSDMYTLSPTETRRLKALTAGVPFDADPFAGLPADEGSHTRAIAEVLRAVTRHHELVASS